MKSKIIPAKPFKPEMTDIDALVSQKPSAAEMIVMLADARRRMEEKGRFDRREACREMLGWLKGWECEPQKHCKCIDALIFKLKEEIGED